MQYIIFFFFVFSFVHEVDEHRFGFSPTLSSKQLMAIKFRIGATTNLLFGTNRCNCNSLIFCFYVHSYENEKWNKKLWQKADLNDSEPLFDSRRAARTEPVKLFLSKFLWRLRKHDPLFKKKKITFPKSI